MTHVHCQNVHSRRHYKLSLSVSRCMHSLRRVRSSPRLRQPLKKASALGGIAQRVGLSPMACPCDETVATRSAHKPTSKVRAQQAAHDGISISFPGFTSSSDL